MLITMRDRAEIAHKTHNLKVVGLNPTRFEGNNPIIH